MQSSPNSADRSTCRPRGRLLRQETAEYELLLRDKFNMALRLNYLEDQLRLLKDGEGYTETDILMELSNLRSALKAREHELRERTLKQINVVDELETQLEEVKAAAGVEDKIQGQRDIVVSGSATHYQEMCSALQEKLDDMAQQTQKATDDANDNRRQVKRLLADFEQHGKAMRDLKKDHDKALDTIYKLESELLQQHHDESEEHSKTTRSPTEYVSEGHGKNQTKESNELGVAVIHRENIEATTSDPLKGDNAQIGDTNPIMKSYRDLCLKLQDNIRCLTQANQEQLEKNERLRLDNGMLSHALRETKQEVSTIRADLDVATRTICHLDEAYLQLPKQHEVKVQQLEKEVSQVKHEKKTLDSMWTHRYNNYRRDKEREILKLKEKTMHTMVMVEREPTEKTQYRARDGDQALEDEQENSRKDSLQHLQESNRFAFKDLQECYGQYKVIFRENTDLLKAIKIYKKAIADRDADIANYKAEIMKYLHQLKHRSSLEQTSDVLASQLKETKSMIAVISKHLKRSCFINDGRGGNENSSVSARRCLKAIHGDRLAMLSKQLEDVEKRLHQ